MTTAEPKNKIAYINKKVPSSLITQVKRLYTGFPTRQDHQHQYLTNNNNINKGSRLSRKTISTADNKEYIDNKDNNINILFKADNILWARTKYY